MEDENWKALIRSGSRLVVLFLSFEYGLWAGVIFIGLGTLVITHPKLLRHGGGGGMDR